jgi:guanylate kinase
MNVAKSELAAQDEFPHVVVNDRLEEAVEELAAIVASGMGAGGRRVHSDA